MEKERKHFTLKNGVRITIRPMMESDFDASLKFFQSFPEKDRIRFRTDVTRPENITKRMDLMKSGAVSRLVAEYEDKIIADGALERSSHQWERHIGEIRVFIHPRYRRLGLAMILIREFYFQAMAEKLEKITVHLMRDQREAHAICRRLGFHEEIIMPDHVRDQNGATHDMLIMTIDIRELWEEMEDYFFLTDIQQDR